MCMQIHLHPSQFCSYEPEGTQEVPSSYPPEGQEKESPTSIKAGVGGAHENLQLQS